jgi:hypothetical protein
VKLKSFCTSKETDTRIKIQPTECEEIFVSSSKITTIIYKELKKLNTKRTNNTINKWANELHRQFSKEVVQMANKFNIPSCKGNANQIDTERVHGQDGGGIDTSYFRPHE